MWKSAWSTNRGGPGLRFRSLLLVIVTVTTGLSAVAPAKAAPWPKTDFFIIDTGLGWSNTTGTITWYNRSVNITGSIINPYSQSWRLCSQVRFAAVDQHGRRIGPEQTRSVCNDERGFNFGVDASTVQGGVRVVYVNFYLQDEWQGQDRCTRTGCVSTNP